MLKANRDDVSLPAIKGGTPVRDALLPYGHQSIDKEDIAAVVDALQADWITTGPKAAKFEEAIAQYVGSKYAVCFSSGTAALHGAAYAAKLGPGDEAITTPMTFCATSNCAIYLGSRPVFADILPDTLNIDPGEIARQITSKTKAVLPVDFAGHPADLDEIRELAERHNLTVIEDACHALGARYKGTRVGGICDMTVFSFHPVKHITTGEGGMVTTDDPDLARRLKLFRNHGIDSDAKQRLEKDQWFYQMIDLGYNYRLTELASALGISQLGRLDKNLSRRREIASIYKSAFKGLKGIKTPVEKDFVSSAWHLYTIRLNFDVLNSTRSEIFAALRAENIGVNVHYIPVHYHPYYKEHFGYRGGEYPVAEAAYQSLISIPMFHGMTDKDIQDVIDAVSKVINYFSERESKLCI